MNSMSKHEQSGKMSRGAFTLVEVAIATALLVIALALFLSTFVSAKRSAVIADNRMDAVHNARMAMETLLSYKYAAAQLNVGSRTIVATSIVSGVTNYSTNYYSVAIVTQNPGIVVKNIYVTNSWINPGTKITSTVSLVGSVSPQLHP